MCKPKPVLEGFKEAMCGHGMCYQHDPQWKESGKPIFVPKLSFILRRKTYVSYRCCGKQMMRMEKVQPNQCSLCGRKDQVLIANFAVCSCCGRKKEIEQVDDGGGC